VKKAYVTSLDNSRAVIQMATNIFMQFGKNCMEFLN